MDALTGLCPGDGLHMRCESVECSRSEGLLPIIGIDECKMCTFSVHICWYFGRIIRYRVCHYVHIVSCIHLNKVLNHFPPCMRREVRNVRRVVFAQHPKVEMVMWPPWLGKLSQKAAYCRLINY